MHKIDTYGHANNQFTEGDPVHSVPATIVGAVFLNTIQNELVAVIEAAGLTLDKADNAQLLAAIQTLGGDTRIAATMGAEGDGDTDDTIALQALLDYTKANHSEGIIGPQGYALSATLTVDAATHMKISGASSSGGSNNSGAYGVRLLWGGANAGTVLAITDSRDSKFSNIGIVPKTTETIGVGIDLDGANCTWLEFDTITISKRNGTLTRGVQIANTSTSGCDIFQFKKLFVQDATDGVHITDGQSKWHSFYDCTFSRCGTGINAPSGSFILYSPNFSHNDVDIVLGAPTDNINIYSPQSEGAQRFLYQTDAYSAAMAINVCGGRLTHDSLHPDGNYIVYNSSGPLNLFGVDFAVGIHNASWRILANNVSGFYSGNVKNGTIHAVGCIFPNDTIIDWSVSNVNFTCTSCRYVLPDGSSAQLPDITENLSTKQLGLYPQSFGAKGDGVTDDTVAIQAAIDALPKGGRLLLTSNTFLYTELTIDNSITIAGQGWYCSIKENFGNPGYLLEASMRGSVLRSTKTAAGPSIISQTSNNGPRFEGVAVIGPGTGLSRAISFGAGDSYQILGKWDDVLFANFYQGVVMANVEDYTFDTLRIRGMSTEGLLLESGVAGTNVTQDVFLNLEIQKCGTGIKATEAAGCQFYGGLLQGNDIGLELAPSADGRVGGLKFEGFWYETNMVVDTRLDLTNGGIQHLTFDHNIWQQGGNLFDLINPNNNTVSFLTLQGNVGSSKAADFSPGASVGPAYAFVSGTGNEFGSVIPSNATFSRTILETEAPENVTWDATPTGLTHGGVLTSTATYSKINNMVFFSITLVDTVSMSANPNTYFLLPINTTGGLSTAQIVNHATGVSIGVSEISSNVVYGQTWSVGAGVPITISGYYQV